MEYLIEKYSRKLVESGLTEKDAPIFGALDVESIWNRHDVRYSPILEQVLEKLNISSLLFAPPAEPWRTVIEYLAANGEGVIRPEDTETRTFLHDLPVVTDFNADDIIAGLQKRKGIIVPGCGIITFGTVSSEQAFVTFSSICFAVFVKFFSDVLFAVRRGRQTEAQMKTLEKAAALLEAPSSLPEALVAGPFVTEKAVHAALEEAGRLTVTCRLVDSYFGNISYRMGDILYISQTGSSLDELEGCIDPCPLDGSSCVGITASSELPLHRRIVSNTDVKAILHGHPKFAVILSMDCERDDCEFRGLCYRKCPHPRFVHDIPVVPGEVGAGPFGLCNTVPAAMTGKRGVIVYGHGLFTFGTQDFNEPFRNLFTIEHECREEYFRRVGLGSS